MSDLGLKSSELTGEEGSLQPVDSTILMPVLRALRGLRIGIAGLDEWTIRDRVANLLIEQGFSCRTEVVFAPRCRADILIEGGIVIELKKQRPRTQDVLAQLVRYAKTGVVQGLILVLERSVSVPESIEGVPCKVVSLNSQWGIAL